jgi:Flp pilus assembly pilin Flp
MLLAYIRARSYIQASLERQEGQALVEYALILALISVVAIGVLEVIGVNVTSVLGRIGNDL